MSYVLLIFGGDEKELSRKWSHGAEVGDKKLSRKVKLLIAVIAGALIISLSFNRYYENKRVENENLLHAIRASTLRTFGYEVLEAAYDLKEYLETESYDIYQRVTLTMNRAGMLGNILTQGLTEEAAQMYFELKEAAWTVNHYFVSALAYVGPFNLTTVGVFAQALDSISSTMNRGNFLSIIDKDPLEVLSQTEIDEIIHYCQQIQEMV